ncbi:MAG: gamma carbonic anhydrase family protein [Planctomycetes bacterium]|nr:gamma carbonic anhydrase family protein [Planctomycetota bacterium]
MQTQVIRPTLGIHTRSGVPLDIEDEVGIGHRAVVHCRRVGRRSLIGIGSTVLDDAEIGEGSLVGAAALVPPGMIVPPGKVVVGIPARVIRDVTDEDRAYISFVIENYVRLGRVHASGTYPNAAER